MVWSIMLSNKFKAISFLALDPRTLRPHILQQNGFDISAPARELARFIRLAWATVTTYISVQ